MSSQENYHVFLRPDILPEAREFFSLFSSNVVLANGTELQYLRCSKIDAGHSYLEVTVHPSRAGLTTPMPFQIPHYMVLAISGPTESPSPIGFGASDA